MKIIFLSNSRRLESREMEKKERDQGKGRSTSSWGTSLKSSTRRLAGSDEGVSGEACLWVSIIQRFGSSESKFESCSCSFVAGSSWEHYQLCADTYTVTFTCLLALTNTLIHVFACFDEYLNVSTHTHTWLHTGILASHDAVNTVKVCYSFGFL